MALVTLILEHACFDSVTTQWKKHHLELTRPSQLLAVAS
jgi:hypothetical protein